MVEPDLELPLPAAAAAVRAKSGRWPKSSATKQAVLDAARVLFSIKGYEATSINELVKASGVSVGSIYHQFGGKAEVFMALAREALSSNAAASTRATEQARAAGETRPGALYVAGAKAHLIDTWRLREVTRFLFGDDVPPGFSEVRREAVLRFMHGARRLRIGDPPLPDLSAHAVTSLVNAAALQIVQIDDAATAEKIADYFTGLILRLVDEDG
ncbi:TetR family transcriptional regulator [Nocardia sp. R7R-8]|uniref:TetR family transcriptional regulator n=1 Tax=Nocardia sp. R7R-8 TaxID=3459304 RepID=UPI00403DB7E7